MPAIPKKNGSSLAILWIVLPVVIGLFIAIDFGPMFLRRFEKGQVVRFTPYWLSIQNTSRTNWLGGEAILNSACKVRFPEMPPGKLIEINYVQFTNGLRLHDIQQLAVKVDGAAPLT